jgi:hypothetical protein
LQNIIITLPGYILSKYPLAKRQLFWTPRKNHYSFLQLGWSGGVSAKTKRSVFEIRAIGNP